MNNEQIILIVDDDPDHLAVIERYVSSYGLQYKSARNGVEATECLKADNVSVVVTDMVMPEMDGMELLKHTKAQYENVDVIIMTGYSSQYSYIDVIRAGATDFIAKPFKKDEFFAKLDRLFKERNLLKELRAAKEKAEAASQKAEAASQAKTSFLCTISHELRTPMNGILGFTGLLADAELAPAEAKYVEYIAKSADRLMKLINQMLDFSKIEAGDKEVEYCHFQLEIIFKDLAGAIQQSAAAKGLEVKFDADESLSELTFLGDQSGIAQILYNLADNAVRFTESGSIEIKAMKVRDFSDDSMELQFSIKDTGCGLDPEKQTEIFEPFTQAEGYMTRKHGGAGLGLAICAKLAKTMHGKIWVESQIGKGSTFYFTVKLASA